jgi:hypothetical protein
MRNAHTFFLTSTEASPTLIPRKSWIVEKLWSDERQAYFMRIHIDPPIAGGHIGISQEVLDELVIAPRYMYTSLFPTRELPITVFVCSIVNNQIQNTGQVSAKDLRILFIGEIYSTMADAEKAIHHEKIRY